MEWQAKDSEHELAIVIEQDAFDGTAVVEFHVRCDQPIVSKRQPGSHATVTIPVSYPGEYRVTRRVEYIDGGSKVEFSEPQFVNVFAGHNPPPLPPPDTLSLAQSSPVKEAKETVKKAAKKTTKKAAKK